MIWRSIFKIHFHFLSKTWCIFEVFLRILVDIILYFWGTSDVLLRYCSRWYLKRSIMYWFWHRSTSFRFSIWQPWPSNQLLARQGREETYNGKKWERRFWLKILEQSIITNMFDYNPSDFERHLLLVRICPPAFYMTIPQDCGQAGI